MKNILFYFVILTLLQSCITPKAGISSKSNLNNNSAIFSINGAKLNNKKSLIGITTQIISAGVGGYLGYKYFPVALGYSDGKLNASSMGGAVLGSIAGYGINNSVNYLLGEKREYSVNQKNFNTWKESYDPNEKFIAVNNNYSNLEFVDKSYESIFSVNNLQDAIYFKKAFPQSQYSKSVFDRTLNVTDREYLPTLSKLFPKVNRSELFKKHLVTSRNFAEYKNSIDLFPENKLNLKQTEKKAVMLVKNHSDAEQFRELFPLSKLNKQVVLNALQECDDIYIPKLAKLFGSEFNLNETDFKSLETNNNLKRKYLNSQFILSQPQSLHDLEKLFTQYRWLNYAEKPKDALKYYWNVSYSNSSESTTILKTIENLYKDTAYRDLKITENDANNFIKEMLRNEANKVYVKSTYSKGTTNPEWEAWLKNDSYSAGIVNNQGEIKFIVYGTLINNSKFDLPLKITSTGTLMSTTEIKGTGTITNLIIKFAEKFSGGEAPTKQVINLGNKTGGFSIPNLQPAKESTYAILFDFGTGNINKGVNFNDLFKVKSEISLTDIKTTVQFSEERPSDNTLKEQDNWQNLAKNGLPNATLTDFWRGGKEVNDQEWREEYSRILDARREANATFDAEWESKKEQKEAEAVIKKEVRDFQDFKSRTSFKFLEIIEEKGIIFRDFTGSCPCEKYELRKENYWIDDKFDIYQDKRGKWYILKDSFTRDSGPYNTSDDLLKYIYKEYFNR